MARICGLGYPGLVSLTLDTGFPKRPRDTEMKMILRDNMKMILRNNCEGVSLSWSSLYGCSILFVVRSLQAGSMWSSNWFEGSPESEILLNWSHSYW